VRISRKLFATGQQLKADLTTLEVVGKFDEEGLRSILLKGPSWSSLYGEEERRPYVDSDLLVSPENIKRAEQILQRLRFEHPPLDDTPGDRPWHAHAWLRRSDERVLDLHRTLIGVGLPPSVLWEVLSQETETMSLRGKDVEILNPAGRALHVGLHAAQDGIKLGKPLDDLRRALERTPIEVWRKAASLARRLQAESAFARGLGQNPEGARLAHELGLESAPTMEVELRALGAPQIALTMEWVARSGGLRTKAALLARKLLPSPEFMRSWSPLAKRGRLGLVAAYAWRVVWGIGRLPLALSYMRKAHRERKQNKGTIS
jgi:hypothetical protein